MKKVWPWLLAVALSLCACAGNAETVQTSSGAQESAAETAGSSGAASEAASGEAFAGTEAGTGETTDVPTGTEPAPAEDPIEALRGKTVAEADRALMEQAVVQTAMAYYYKNPYCQYNRTTTLTVMEREGSFLDTQDRSPESITADNMYYSHCRSFCSEIYTEAFGWDMPSLVYGWLGAFNDPSVYGNSNLDIVMQYTQKPAGKIWGLDAAHTYRDISDFVQDMKEVIRPGDIIFGEKNEKTNGGHVLLYLGDVFGDGEAYCLHSWPVDGGSMGENGANKWEPNGSAILQRADEVLFREDTAKNEPNRTPNWSVAAKKDDGTPNMYYCWLIRPLQNGNLTGSLIPEKTLTRLRYPFLSVEKDLGLWSTDTVVPGELITVEETVTSHRDADFEGVSLSERIPAGTRLVDGSVTGGGSEKDGVISWRFDVAAGSAVTVSYRLEVTAKAGESIFFEDGRLNDLPTRSEEIRVGVGHLTPAQEARLAKAAFSLPETVKPDGFLDLDYVNLFYRTVLGMDPALPERTEDLVAALFTKCRPEGWKDELLTPKREIAAADKALAAMTVRKNLFGYYVYLDEYLTNTYHFLDLKSEFYEPGDVFVTADNTADPAKGISAESLGIYVYLGDGQVLEHTAEGTRVTTWAASLQKALLDGLFAALRPAQVLETDKAPGAGDDPEDIFRESENLALRADISTTYDPVRGASGKVTYPIEKIIDGDHSAAVSTSCRYQWTKDGYILLDLGAEYTLTGYRLYNYEWPYQWCINKAWTVYGSADGSRWTELAHDEIDCSAFTKSVKYYSDVKNGDPDGGNFEPVRAQYVKLVIDEVFVGEGVASGYTEAACSSRDVRIYELEVLGY